MDTVASTNKRNMYYKDVWGPRACTGGQAWKVSGTEQLQQEARNSSFCSEQHHTSQLGFNPNIPLSLSHSLKRQSLGGELMLIGQSQVTWISLGCQGKRVTICP